MRKSNSISLIIPAYNEEKEIGRTLGDLQAYLTEHYPSFEIIVIDDGSKDRTSDIVTDFIKQFKNIYLIKNEINRGKGYSAKRGVLASSGDIIVYSDADQSVPIGELPKFIKAIEEGADIAISSRRHRDSYIVRRQALWRQTMGRIFNIFVQLIVFKGISDTQCGFKCFKRDAAQYLFREQKICRFAFDVEILYLAILHGYSIAELPIRWINLPQTRVRPFSDSIIMLKDLFVISHLKRTIR